MLKIKEIENQYFDLENYYWTKEYEALTKGHHQKEHYWFKKREINTHALFLLMFSRLEDHIDKQVRTKIQYKQNNISHWRQRAIWDITNPDSLNFKNKVALLTQKGASDFNLVMDYYGFRNRIAHGETITNINTQINMVNFFTNIKRLMSNLK